MQVTALLAAELTAPFTRATDADAATLVSRHWGLTPARANRVDTERDDTFRVETSHASYALKIAPPADDRTVIDLQTAAIEWAADHDPSLPLARPIPTVDATLQPVVAGGLPACFPGCPVSPCAPRSGMPHPRLPCCARSDRRRRA